MRAGAEDDSSADNPATDTGTEQTTSWMISIPEPATAAAEHKLQNYIWGWAKVTSTTGLKIHQDSKGCLKKGQLRSRIDRYFLRSRPSRSTEVQQQDKNQNLQDNNHPVPAEEEPGTGEQPKPSPLWPAAEKIQGQNPLIKWTKSCKKAIWEDVNIDLCNILEQHHERRTIKKLEWIGELISVD